MNKRLEAIREARRVAKKAYCPYSKYYVGCSIVSKSGKIFTGANIENRSYGATICAERSALSQYAINTFNVVDEIATIVITNEKEIFHPCGICLQSLSEFTNSSTEVIIYCPSLKVLKVLKFGDFLPRPF